jgi:predicted DNA-binding transcriptional regulator YafY
VDTPTRLLRLLALLSSRPWWRAAELAGETGTTERTVRRDVTRLRELGYPVDATTGPYGGYTLGRGGRMPPLVLDDDEAVAVSVALRAGARGASGAEAAALSALAKLDQVLPARLRTRVSALAAMSVGLRNPGRPAVDVDALMTVALACRACERLRFTYTDAGDRTTDRHVEPHRLVYTDRWWYLVAYDTMRADWRSFRIDRTRAVSSTGERFVPSDEAPDPAAFVAEGIAIGGYEIQARVLLHVPVHEAARLVPPTIAVLEAAGDSTTIARVGGEADWIARFLAGLECRFEVLEPDEVRRELRALGRRLVRLGS